MRIQQNRRRAFNLWGGRQIRRGTVGGGNGADFKPGVGKRGIHPVTSVGVFFLQLRVVREVHRIKGNDLG